MKKTYLPLLNKIIIFVLIILSFSFLFNVHVYAVDDYPSNLRSGPMDINDPWQFASRNCTSFVAWRMNRDAGHQVLHTILALA